MITAVSCSTNDTTEHNDIAAARQDSGVTWVRATNTTPREQELIREEFGIHPLATEDVLNTVRPKTEEYPEYTFVLLKTASLAAKETTFRDELDTDPIGLFIGRDWLVTLSVSPIKVVEQTQRTVIDNPQALPERDADFIAYLIVDKIVESYFDVLDQLEIEIETIEEQIVETTDADVLTSLNEVRRELLSFRRLLWPSREAVGVLARGDPTQTRAITEKYYRDVYDHLVQLVELTETYRTLASGARDIYLSTLSQSTNEVMKTLTVVATIVLPLTLVVGLYGMNFETMPELSWSLGYPAVLFGMVVISLTIVIYFRRQNYI
ncbi:magnesium/cobalt transporter CorA [Halococcus saccharolyticus]|uniref:Magnesium transport protein CorA n=1 Tax=Halococcus saccharolyticus DSM 5350 TaxID=1227455 RepID=M0ME69_9EURY|nr:magnesium/cobalt transporter CorA [Halococcus saccharolyticus]EMA43623.1 magnesium and cobalt transporter CorA [Halococcus saccharolyticus DSM 5350]